MYITPSLPFLTLPLHAELLALYGGPGRSIYFFVLCFEQPSSLSLLLLIFLDFLLLFFDLLFLLPFDLLLLFFDLLFLLPFDLFLPFLGLRGLLRKLLFGFAPFLIDFFV